MRPTRHFYAGLIVRRERGPFALAHLSKQKQARQQPGLLAFTVGKERSNSNQRPVSGHAVKAAIRGTLIIVALLAAFALAVILVLLVFSAPSFTLVIIVIIRVLFPLRTCSGPIIVLFSLSPCRRGRRHLFSVCQATVRP